MGARGFQKIDRSLDIDALIKRRLFQAWPHSGSCGQVDDLVKSYAAEHLAQGPGLGQAALDELKRPAARLNVLQVPALELRIVEVVQVIERPHGVAAFDQAFAHMRADEAGAARDQEIHLAKTN